MPNHAARTFVVGVRAMLQRSNLGDTSPANILKIRNSFGLNKPAESSIEYQFGDRQEAWKRSTSDALVDLLHRAARSQSITDLDSVKVISFDSIIEGFGPVISIIEGQRNSSTNVREDIAIIASLVEEAIDAAVHKQLLPRAICLDILSALRTYGEKNAHRIGLDHTAVITLSEGILSLPTPNRVPPPYKARRRSQPRRKVPVQLPNKYVRMSVLRKFEPA